jgi:hypothetical protein
MAANVEHRFRKGYLLDEERLRKLHSVIRDRIAGSDAEGQLRFKVYRGDAFSYETNELETVLGEDNADWRRLTRVDFGIRTAALNLMLIFSSQEGARLNIYGEDRDRVFLLFSDIRQYLEEEVTLSRFNTGGLPRFVALLLLAISMVLVVVSTMLTGVTRIPRPEAVSSALAATDARTKLDFLISQTREAPHTGTSRWLMAGAMAAMLLVPLALTSLPGRVLAYLLPGNIFIFGAQKARFDRRRRLIGNVVWVVLIGFIVSFAAGVVVWYMTLRRP